MSRANGANDLLYRQLPGAVKKGRPLLGFDFDGTLWVHRRRGFDPDLTARVLAKLSDHFNIAIFSNRSCRTPKSITPIQEYSARVDGLTGRKNTVGIMAARGDSSYYRKACTHMWDEYLELLTAAHGYEFCPAGSFFCGDAAGRDGDFASTDCAFAHNIGVRFLVPEQVFACVGGSWDSPTGTDPDQGYSAEDLETLAGRGKKPIGPEGIIDVIRGEPDRSHFVLMMGAPASGKSTLAAELHRLAGARRDECLLLDENDMRKFPKCVSHGSAVIVADATHPTFQRRKEVLQWARKNGYRTIIAHMDTSPKLCEHLNMARGQLAQYLVPIIAHRVYWKNCVPPADREADVVIRTRFYPTGGAPPEVTRFRY